MGTVYRALDRELNRTVAVKVLKPEFVHNVQNLLRLKREIVLASRVSHEHVVRVYDIGTIDGRALISMDWVDGENLADLLKRVFRLPPSQVFSLAIQICEALGAIHRAGIVHQDLKPSNLLIRKDGAILVADFGVARSLVPHDERISKPGEIVGTRAYMAPEQIVGLPTDARSDLYSFGLVLLEMLTAAPALEALGPLRLQWLAPDQDIRQGWAELRYLSALDLVIRGCVQADRTARFSSADEALKILKLADAESTPHPSAPANDAPAKIQSRSRRRCFLFGLLLVIVFVIAYAGYRRLAASRARQFEKIYAKAASLVTDQSGVAELKSALHTLDQFVSDPARNLDVLRLRLDTWVRLYEQTRDPQWLDEVRHALESRTATHLSRRERTLFRARIELDAGLFQRVIRSLQGDSELLASSETANRLLGAALQGSQQPELAVQSYRAAIRLDPESWRAHNELGLALVALGRFQEARRHFVRVTELRPDSPTGYENLGLVQMYTGDFPSARGSFETVLRLSTSPNAYYSLGLVSFLSREYATSIPFFETAIQIQPADLYFAGLADSLRKLHRTERARENYARALSLINELTAARPLTVSEQSRRAIYLARLGDPTAASALPEVAGADNHKDVAYARAIIAMLDGRVAAANRHLKDAVRLGHPPILIEMSPEFDDLPP